MAVVITFCSLKDGIGKTLVSSHLAYLLYQFGYNVVLMDADFRFHELTKKLCGARAVLKLPEYNHKVFTTLSQFLETDLREPLVWEDLLIPIATPQEQKQAKFWQFWPSIQKKAANTNISALLAPTIHLTSSIHHSPDDPSGDHQANHQSPLQTPWLWLLPSYYRDPLPFWQSSPIQFLPDTIHKMLSYYQTIADFIIVDTTTFHQAFLDIIHRISNHSIWMVPPLEDVLQETQEYCASYFLPAYHHTKVSLLSNMLLHRQNNQELGLRFSVFLLAFDQQRHCSTHSRCRFIWDMLDELPNCVLNWTMELIELSNKIQQSKKTTI